MAEIRQIGYLPVLILLATVISVHTGLGSTTIYWMLSFVTVVSVLWNKWMYFDPDNRKDYRIVALYLIWMIKHDIGT